MSLPKPTVKIRNAILVVDDKNRNRLTGYIDEHPKYPVMEEDSFCRSSPVIDIEGNRVETMNTIYLVESWVTNGI